MKKAFRRVRKKLILGFLARGYHIPIGFLDKYRELVYLRELLIKERIDCVLDVGANIGQFAEDLRYIGFAGRIISFEPIKAEFEKLSRLFANDANWKGYQIALGSETGVQKINISADSMLSSLLENSAYVDFDHQETVTVQRLDQIFDSLDIGADNARVLLKTDAQGYDIEVFKGASSCIERITAVLAEISAKPLYENVPDYKQALQVYQDAGFKLVNITIVFRSDKDEVIDMNCLLKRV